MVAIETDLRKSTLCKGCGKSKSIGLVVCWDCFKYRDDNYKNSGLNITDWLEKINQIKGDN